MGYDSKRDAINQIFRGHFQLGDSFEVTFNDRAGLRKNTMRDNDEQVHSLSVKWESLGQTLLRGNDDINVLREMDAEDMKRRIVDALSSEETRTNGRATAGAQTAQSVQMAMMDLRIGQ